MTHAFNYPQRSTFCRAAFTDEQLDPLPECPICCAALIATLEAQAKDEMAFIYFYSERGLGGLADAHVNILTGLTERLCALQSNQADPTSH